jgi:SAM-dependent methyltransferase
MQMTVKPERDEKRLLEVLRQLDRTTQGEEWVQGLEQRKRQELEFHDDMRDPSRDDSDSGPDWELHHPNKKYYESTKESVDAFQAWIRQHAPGKVFVDFACGNGITALAAAEAGASLAIGIDISPQSIQNARRAAAERGLVGRTYFLVGDCERTGLPDDSVDIVMCHGCLHHLDLSYAFPEIRRILRPGGRCLAIEASAHNPFIQLYRKMTPHLRTPFEKDHILSLREVDFARRFFDVENLRFFHLFSLCATPLRRTRWFGPVLRLANRADRLLLRFWPFSRLAWMFSFELVKKVPKS